MHYVLTRKEKKTSLKDTWNEMYLMGLRTWWSKSEIVKSQLSDG